MENKIEKERQIEIKSATNEDLKDIQELNHQLCLKESIEFDATINEEYPIQENGEKYFKERIDNGFAFIVKIDNKIVGYMIGGISEGSDYRKISKIAEAESMYIAYEYRSMGLGNKLFKEFFNWCKLNNLTRVRVVASSKNNEAIKFYKREGFEDYDVVLEKDI